MQRSVRKGRIYPFCAGWQLIRPFRTKVFFFFFEIHTHATAATNNDLLALLSRSLLPERQNLHFFRVFGGKFGL